MIPRDAFQPSQSQLFCDADIHQHILLPVLLVPVLSWFDTVKMYVLHAWTADVLYTHPQAILITPPNFRLSVQFSQQRCFYVFPDH